MMFRHVSHVFLFLFSGLCSTAVNAQDQIIPRPVSVKVEAKGAATPVKLDEGMRIICKEKDGEFRRQAHLLQQFLSRGTGLALDGAGGTGIIRVVKDAALKQYGGIPFGSGSRKYRHQRRDPQRSLLCGAKSGADAACRLFQQ